jgi:hypothetical protein
VEQKKQLKKLSERSPLPVASNSPSTPDVVLDPSPSEVEGHPDPHLSPNPDTNLDPHPNSSNIEAAPPDGPVPQKSTSLWVGNLPPSVTKNELEDVLGGEVVCLKQAGGNEQKFAILKFPDPETTKKAKIQWHNTKPFGGDKGLSVSFFKEKKK